MAVEEGLTDVHTRVEPVEAEHDRHDTRPHSLSITLPSSKVEIRVEHHTRLQFRREVRHNNHHRKEPHHIQQKRKALHHRQHASQPRRHKHCDSHDRKEDERRVPVLHLIGGMHGVGKRDYHVGRHEGHARGARLPCNGEDPAGEVGEEVGGGGRREDGDPVVLAARERDHGGELADDEGLGEDAEEDYWEGYHGGRRAAAKHQRRLYRAGEIL
jgi:hypothetical protein